MVLSEERKKMLISEFRFSATRSQGPGGQNVNKVNTRVELRYSLDRSLVFSQEEKEKIHTRLKNRINAEGELVLFSGTERSQWRNREKAIERLFGLFEKALTPVKKRVKTSPTASSRLKRLEGKKLQARKKLLRKRPEV